MGFACWGAHSRMSEKQLWSLGCFTLAKWPELIHIPKGTRSQPQEAGTPSSPKSQEVSQGKDWDCSHTGGWSSEEFRDLLSCDGQVLTITKARVKWVTFRKTDGSCPQTSHLPLTPS